MDVSRLLALPAELRKEIWDLLLAPNSTTKPGINDKDATTTVSRACSSAGVFVYKIYHAHAHEADDMTCRCHARSFYIHDDSRKLCPAILRVNKQVYAEALPSLYERRTFALDPNRKFVSLWDRCAEAWFLFYHFLRGLSEDARQLIRSIKLPMPLSRYEVQSARHMFYSISRLLPSLTTFEIEISPSTVSQRWFVADDPVHLSLHEVFDRSTNFFLGPLLAFADAKLIITAVDKYDLGPVIFARIKPHIETVVWQQLLEARVKHEYRRMKRIKRALGALEYDEVAVEECDPALLC